MTREELADRLDRLDPGAVLRLDDRLLAEVFGETRLEAELARRVEEFALEHRCTFLWHEHGQVAPCFEKDDVF
jgi:hypothetical protein